jgi:hypothetical protein
MMEGVGDAKGLQALWHRKGRRKAGQAINTGHITLLGIGLR